MKVYAFIAFLVLGVTTTSAQGNPGSDSKPHRNIPFPATPEPTASSSMGCSMEVCFAIEGSNMINQKQFDLQKEFITELVGRVADTSNRNDVFFAAAQYGVANDVISFLTKDTSSFLDAVEKTRFRKTEVNFVSGGIIFCHRDLFTTGVENGVIVLLGTGRSTFGGDPVEAARNYGGKILTVGVGKSKEKTLLDIVGGNRGRSFYLNVNNVQSIVNKVLQKICFLGDRKGSQGNHGKMKGVSV